MGPSARVNVVFLLVWSEILFLGRVRQGSSCCREKGATGFGEVVTFWIISRF